MIYFLCQHLLQLSLIVSAFEAAAVVVNPRAADGTSSGPSGSGVSATLPNRTTFDLDGTSDDINVLNATDLYPGLSLDAGAPPGRHLNWSPDSIANLTQSGNYNLWQCNTPVPGGSADNLLLQLLPQLWSDLQSVITEISRSGLGSSHGLEALFKTNDNLDTANEIFHDISDGDPIEIVSVPGFQHNPQPPLIVCAHDGILANQFYQNQCNLRPAAAAMHAEGTNVLWLCERFWKLPIAPAASRCPKTRFNAILGHGWGLSYSQKAVLVHELAAMYLGVESLTARGGTLSQFLTVYDAIALSAGDAVKNPGSFAFAYACGLK